MKTANKITRKQQVLENAYHKCNLIGENVNIFEVIYDYKTIFKATDKEHDAIYNYIAERMGLGSNLVSNNDWSILSECGWLQK